MTDAKPRASFWDAIGRLPGEVLRRQDETLAALNRIERLLTRAEKKMAKGQEKLSQEIEKLSKKVSDYTSARGQEIKRAVEEARAAWEQDSQDDFDAAVEQLAEIGKKLDSENPGDPDFEPSGNTP